MLLEICCGPEDRSQGLCAPTLSVLSTFHINILTLGNRPLTGTLSFNLLCSLLVADATCRSFH